MRQDQFKISIFILGVFCLFALFISMGNEGDIYRLTEQNKVLTAKVDSLEVVITTASYERWAIGLEVGVHNAKYH